jgi:hypothetical protein
VRAILAPLFPLSNSKRIKDLEQACQIPYYINGLHWSFVCIRVRFVKNKVDAFD